MIDDILDRDAVLLLELFPEWKEDIEMEIDALYQDVNDQMSFESYVRQIDFSQAFTILSNVRKYKEES